MLLRLHDRVVDQQSEIVDLICWESDKAASIDAPVGGTREPGLGRRQGSEGTLRRTDTQSVACA